MNAPLKLVGTVALPITGLPEGRTAEQAFAKARAKKEFLWTRDMEEDDRIDALVDFCTSLYQGNAASGQDLATTVVWS